jgi:hypothetical protein
MSLKPFSRSVLIKTKDKEKMWELGPETHSRTAWADYFAKWKINAHQSRELGLNIKEIGPTGNMP